jgi:hypothetical protein
MDKAVSMSGNQSLKEFCGSMTEIVTRDRSIGTLDDGHCGGVKCCRDVARTTLRTGQNAG